jgi:hypothetical protein
MPTAFEAITATLPLESVGYEAQTNGKGKRLISGRRKLVAGAHNWLNLLLGA